MLSRDEDAILRIERLQDHQGGKRQHQATLYYLRHYVRGPKAPTENVGYGKGREVTIHYMEE